ncbi:hypothetical protein CWR43_14025 [Rhizobium sullae]|uniref:Uncharacterized protein n=1 Tax=Rhizobium sullae TaxID=50338 RepID=A0A2N0DAN5_RHISU|nr:hypothetical protein CWR43_14025 [Rhizobium sullae]
MRAEGLLGKGLIGCFDVSVECYVKAMTRGAAIAKAEAYFDSGAFREDLARRVGMPTESQNPDRAPDLGEPSVTGRSEIA